VLVSALKSRSGASFAVLDAVFAGKIEIATSVALVLEYDDVLKRPGLIPALSSAEVDIVIDSLCDSSIHQSIFYTWRPQLTDPDDDMILEVAVAAGASAIITHNIKDFRKLDTFSIEASTPAEVLNLI